VLAVTSQGLWGDIVRGYWERTAAKAWQKRAEVEPQRLKNLVRQSSAHSNASLTAPPLAILSPSQGEDLALVFFLAPTGGVSSRGKALTGGPFQMGVCLHNGWDHGVRASIGPPGGGTALCQSE